jgi:hypothetical protein
MRRNHRSEWIVSVIFSIVGLALIVLSIYVYFDNKKFMADAEKAEATITQITSKRDSDGDIRHTVYVEFEVDGELYEGSLGFYSSSMYEGKTVDVYYDPENPGDFRGEGSSFLSVFLIVLGLIFFLVGGGMIFGMIRKKKRARVLMETGRRVDATIDCIRLNLNYRVNRRHPFVLDLTYADPTTGKVFTFVSDNIWFNVEAVLQNNPITTLSVYIDEQDSRKYYVDLEPLVACLGN